MPTETQTKHMDMQSNLHIWPNAHSKNFSIIFACFFRFAGLAFFPYFGQSHVLVEFYYPGKDEKDAPQLRNYSAATEILFT